MTASFIPHPDTMFTTPTNSIIRSNDFANSPPSPPNADRRRIEIVGVRSCMMNASKTERRQHDLTSYPIPPPPLFPEGLLIPPLDDVYDVDGDNNGNSTSPKQPAPLVSLKRRRRSSLSGRDRSNVNDSRTMTPTARDSRRLRGTYVRAAPSYRPLDDPLDSRQVSEVIARRDDDDAVRIGEDQGGTDAGIMPVGDDTTDLPFLDSSWSKDSDEENAMDTDMASTVSIGGKGFKADDNDEDADDDVAIRAAAAALSLQQDQNQNNRPSSPARRSSAVSRCSFSSSLSFRPSLSRRRSSTGSRRPSLEATFLPIRGRN